MKIAYEILACVDGSKLSEAVCDYGAFLSQSLELPLRLLSTIEHPHTSVVTNLSGTIGVESKATLLEALICEEEAQSKRLMAHSKVLLQTLQDRAQKSGALHVEIEQKHGNLYETLLEKEQSIRVLIIGLRGEQHEENPLAIGSQVEEIVRSLHVPILLINQAFQIPKKVLIAYDGSAHAQKALEMVAKTPLFGAVERHIVTVTKDDALAQKVLEEAKVKFNEQGVILSALHGEPVEALLRYQEEHTIDLIAMGAFSHHVLRDLFFGSFTAKMLLHSTKPLLLLR